jgi:hypothetical protein
VTNEANPCVYHNQGERRLFVPYLWMMEFFVLIVNKKLTIFSTNYKLFLKSFKDQQITMLDFKSLLNI